MPLRLLFAVLVWYLVCAFAVVESRIHWRQIKPLGVGNVMYGANGTQNTVGRLPAGFVSLSPVSGLSANNAQSGFAEVMARFDQVTTPTIDQVLQAGNTTQRSLTVAGFNYAPTGRGSLSIGHSSSGTPPFLQFFTDDAVRRLYIGHASGNLVRFQSENSWGISFAGGDVHFDRSPIAPRFQTSSFGSIANLNFRGPTAGLGLYFGTGDINFAIGGVRTFAMNSTKAAYFLPIDMGASRINNLGAPLTGSDAATKTYVDGLKPSLTFVNGTGGHPALHHNDGRSGITELAFQSGTGISVSRISSGAIRINNSAPLNPWVQTNDTPKQVYYYAPEVQPLGNDPGATRAHTFRASAQPQNDPVAGNLGYYDYSPFGVKSVLPGETVTAGIQHSKLNNIRQWITRIGAQTITTQKENGALRLQPLGADPTGLQQGDLWVNGQTGQVNFFNGSWSSPLNGSHAHTSVAVKTAAQYDGKTVFRVTKTASLNSLTAGSAQTLLSVPELDKLVDIERVRLEFAGGTVMTGDQTTNMFFSSAGGGNAAGTHTFLVQVREDADRLDYVSTYASSSAVTVEITYTYTKD